MRVAGPGSLQASSRGVRPQRAWLPLAGRCLRSTPLKQDPAVCLITSGAWLGRVGPRGSCQQRTQRQLLPSLAHANARKPLALLHLSCYHDAYS